MSRYPGPMSHDPFSPLLPPRTPGSLGKCDAADPNVSADPGDTPGSLGVNDEAEQLVQGNGGGTPLPLRMLHSMIMTAASGKGKTVDPVARAISVTFLNLTLVNKVDVRKKLHEIAQSLGGQDRTNAVLERLRTPLGVRMLQAIYLSAQKQGLDPRFLAAAFFAEADWNEYQPGDLDTFYFVGMDRFLKEYPAMLADGSLTPELSKTFRRTSFIDTGETGERHHRANFSKIEEQIEAFGAFLKHRRKLVQKDLSDMHINEKDLSPDELDYWSYVYYNAGSSPEAGDARGKGKQHLIDERVKKFGVAAVHIPTYRIQSPSDTRNSLGNAQRVLSIKRLLQWAGMADPSDPSSQEVKFIPNVLQVKK